MVANLYFHWHLIGGVAGAGHLVTFFQCAAGITLKFSL